ncbi:hypothetical protein C8Q79DRAFT_455076 [Trametes meyenii]|nr:hypothetical protein C8Q79DRAFT_455076 [Trametes meyenii]
MIFHYVRLIRDYSWTGLRSTMGWIESLRKMHSIPFVPLIEAAPQAFTEVPRLDGDTKASTLRVYASPTIWDQFKDLPQTCNLSDNGSSSKRVSSDSGSLSSYRSNASGESDSSSILDLSYGSTGVLRRFPLVEPHYPEIKTDPKKLRVVIFESFGVILDRNTAINYAMEHIRSVSGSSYSAHTLVLRYNEQEAHVIRNTQLSPAVSLRAIVQDALCRLVYRFAINLSPGSDVLHEALRLIMSPKAYKDAAIAVSRIVRSGIHVVIASPDDPETHQALREELPSGDLHYSTMSTNLILSPYHQKNSPYFEQILSHCQSLYPGTQPQNVLLATVGAARVVEGALWRGIPNALITSPDRPAEARIKLNLPIYPKGGPNPSLEARGLGDLCEQLEL